MFSELGSFSLIFNSSNYFKSWRQDLRLLSLWRGFWHWNTQSGFFHRLVLQHIPFQQNSYTVFLAKGREQWSKQNSGNMEVFLLQQFLSFHCSVHRSRSVHPRLNYSTGMAITCLPLQVTLQTEVSHKAEQSEHPGWSLVPTRAEQGCLGLPCRRSTGLSPRSSPGLLTFLPC